MSADPDNEATASKVPDHSRGRATLTRRTVLGAAAVVGTAAIAGGVAALVGTMAEPPRQTTPSRALTPDELEMTGPGQFRWLTVKNSRIVLNPYDFKESTTEVQQSDAPELPLAAGYFAHNTVAILPDLLFVYGRGKGSSGGTQSGEGLVASVKHRIAWRPYALDFDASWSSGTRIQGFDVFHDANSVTRLIRVSDTPIGSPDGAEIVVGGAYDGDPAFDQSNGVLTITGTEMSYAIALGAGRTVRYYATRPDLQAPGPELEHPGDHGYWAVDLAGTDQAIGIGFAYRGEDADVAARAQQASTLSGADADRTSRRDDIGTMLDRVPRPKSFALPDVPSNGVTAKDVQIAYYRAFTFFQLNVLPPAPEVGYDYPQVATGKPSAWNFGADDARASASWDSLLAIQYYAYVDPETAWLSFQGLMSLVDSEGRLGGESLPSRKAQTAWILYAVTGDRQRLSSVYAQLRRYLLWAEANPRWILGDYDVADEKDLEFVASLLVDFDYARQIADVLGNTSDAAFWQHHRAALLARCTSWFFPGGGEILQHHYTNHSNGDSGGNTLWVTTALHVRGLGGSERKSLLKRFDSAFDPKKPLCGWYDPDVKAPDVTYTAYGLIDVGRATTASEFVQGMLRGIVASRSFAEVYSIDANRTPIGTGVRPSTFGPFNIIDFVWILNGFRGDYGQPAFIILPTTDGGIDGLHTLGVQYSYQANAKEGQVIASGPAIHGGKRSVLRASVGKVVMLPVWGASG